MIFEVDGGRGSYLASEQECIVSTKATKALRPFFVLPLKDTTKLANASTLLE